MKTIKATLDTNVLDPVNLAKILQAAYGLPIVFANVTVSERELEGTSITPLPKPILETAVWDESRWDQAVWGGENDSDLFERLLAIVSNGSFPRPSKRNSLTPGQRRQMRDVMILVAHIREGRDIPVRGRSSEAAIYRKVA
jgi:hypothetical protein